MIKQFTMVMLALFSMAISSAQDVRYYKLTRKEENGKSSTHVSGGQFITFISDICYESNKKGMGVGHGNMMRNSAYSNSQYSVYQGSSYWGKDATFKFNADKSILNVVLENGDVYIYKRTAAPTGQETCSLIRKSGGESGGYTSTPIYPPQPNSITTPVPSTVSIPTPTTSPTLSPEPRKIKKPHTTYKTCHICHGSGVCPTCGGKGWYNNSYGTGKVACPNCSNGKCWKCNGTGKVLGSTEWY